MDRTLKKVWEASIVISGLLIFIKEDELVQNGPVHSSIRLFQLQELEHANL